MKDGLTHGRTYVCNINYHIVWSVKYRNTVLSEQVEAALKKILMETAERYGLTIHLAEVGEMDHVHCFVSAPPTICISDIVKALKGTTGRKLFEQFPHLRRTQRHGELWNHSYYVETIGSVSEENIRRYIEMQRKEPSGQR